VASTDERAVAQTVSVVIRAFNEERHVGRLLTGLQHQNHHVDEVILVDSGSTDSTVAIAEAFGADVVAIDPREFSFGRSLNVGCHAASGDLLAVVSAHVYPVYDTWLSHLVDAVSRPETALAYGRQVGDHRTKFAEERLMKRWFPSESTAQQPHPFCNNANAIVRRDAWQRLPYDEELTGLEDLDWARRAMAAGHKISYVAEAPVVHVHEESWSRLRNRYRREAIAHRRIFHDQRLSATEALSLGARHTVRDWGSALRERRLLKNIGQIPAFHVAQFLGAYEGFREPGELTEQLRRRFYYPAAGETGAQHVEAPGRPIEYPRTGSARGSH
jgi:glycosyltransferase involved in cell wall biosynthesis